MDETLQAEEVGDTEGGTQEGRAREHGFPGRRKILARGTEGKALQVPGPGGV